MKSCGPIDVLIIAARDESDPMRNYLFNQLAISDPDKYLEIPLGRMVRGGRRRIALTWYFASVLEVAKRIGLLSPFNL
jgi:hypothetical protein